MVWHGACAVAPRRNEEDGTAEAMLLRAGRAGDREALGQLLALHERSLLAFCRGIVGQAEEAEEGEARFGASGSERQRRGPCPGAAG